MRDTHKLVACTGLVIFGGSIGCSSEAPTTLNKGQEAESQGNSPVKVSAGTPVFAETNDIREITTVLPAESDTKLVVSSLSRATCRLGEDGAIDDANSLDIYTDASGFADVEIHTAPVGQDTRLVLKCRGDQGQVQASRILVQTQEHAAEPVPRAVGGIQRAALTGDLENMPEAELLSRGYPRRPKLGTEAYTKWAQIVSRPATTIVPEVVVEPEHFHSASTQNWSGGVTGTSSDGSHPGIYQFVYGDWHVQPSAGNTGKMAIWVGLDGWDAGDIIQDGVETDGVKVGSSTLAVSYTWIEYYPEASVRITNFPVSGSQEVFFEAWPCDPDGTTDLGGPYGCFYFYNYATQTDGFTTRPAPAGTAFYGSTAEWILERPTIGSSLATLLSYGAQNIVDPGATESVLGGLSMHDAPGSFTVNMYSGSKLISQALDGEIFGTGDIIVFTKE